MKSKAKPLPKTAKEKAQLLLSAAQQSQERFQVYIEGCKDGLGLDGDYNLNTRAWQFEPMPKENK